MRKWGFIKRVFLARKRRIWREIKGLSPSSHFIFVGARLKRRNLSRNEIELFTESNDISNCVRLDLLLWNNGQIKDSTSDFAEFSKFAYIVINCQSNKHIVLYYCVNGVNCIDNKNNKINLADNTQHLTYFSPYNIHRDKVKLIDIYNRDFSNLVSKIIFSLLFSALSCFKYIQD